jgi:hypothetical protein
MIQVMLLGTAKVMIPDGFEVLFSVNLGSMILLENLYTVKINEDATSLVALLASQKQGFIIRNCR